MLLLAVWTWWSETCCGGGIAKNKQRGMLPVGVETFHAVFKPSNIVFAQTWWRLAGTVFGSSPEGGKSSDEQTGATWTVYGPFELVSDVTW